MSIVMNKMNVTPVFYGSALLLSLFFLNGCAEVRYESNVQTYTSGKYDGVTAHYTLRQGGPPPPQSEVIRTPPEKQLVDSPMVVELADVLFDFDKWVIKEPFTVELNQWADYFNNNPQVSADIYGHTDNTGSTTYNETLSEKRAQAVVNYLIGEGVAPDRLKAKGFGESQPTATNETKKGQQKNRRVEMNF
jgi:outer membrane protein OmpA-like peptidoglycan-associated protein